MPTMILTPEQQIRQQYRWFEVAAQLGDVTVACWSPTTKWRAVRRKWEEL